MAYDFDEVDDRIDWSNILDPSGSPFTLSLWADPDNLAADLEYFFNIDDGVGTRSFSLLKYSAGTGVLQFQIKGSTFMVLRSNTSTLTTGWQNIIVSGSGSLTATNNHIYVNNVEPGYSVTNNGSVESSHTGNWMVGGRTSDNAVNYGGGLSDISWWDRQLDASERAGLSKGYSPLNYMRGLRFAPDLVRGINDPISGSIGSLVSAPTVIPHPRTIRPSAQILSFPTAAAPPVGAIMNQIQKNNLGADLFNGTLL